MTLMPGSKSELYNEVILKSGFKVCGSIYSHRMEGSGSGSVEGPVLVKKEIILEPPTTMRSRMLFAQGLSSGETIQVKFPTLPQFSPVTTYEFNPLIIRGDIFTNSLRIENTVMLGNIHCDDAFIANSIVFGSVNVSRELHLFNSTVISCKAGSVFFHGHNTLLMPFASSDSTFHFDSKPCPPPPGMEKSPSQNHATVRYIGLCNSAQTKNCPLNVFTCKKYLSGLCEYDEIMMSKSDILNVGINNKSDKKSEMLTLTPRLSDTSLVKGNLNNLSQFIQLLNMLPHLTEKSKTLVKKQLARRKEMVHFANIFSHSALTEKHGL